jgi:hypothetical protein
MSRVVRIAGREAPRKDLDIPRKPMEMKAPHVITQRRWLMFRLIPF